MRYAIFSDIHGNMQAWRAALEDMESQGAEVLVCLGDIVGYGPSPQEVLDDLRSRTDNIVAGNHDAAAVGAIDARKFNSHARSVIEWTRTKLNPSSLEFLRSLPLVLETESILFTHAEVVEPGRFGYIHNSASALKNLRACQKPVTFVGHTHFPNIFTLRTDGVVQELVDEDCTLDPERKYIVNVGSVGEPRNPNDIRSRYVLYDDVTRALCFRRVDFDYEEYRIVLQNSGLGATPFFLKVVDHYQEAVAQAQNAESARAMMVDMAAAGDVSSVFADRSRKLIIPARAPSSRTAALHVAVAPPVPPSRGRLGIVIGLILIALGALGFLILKDGRFGGIGEGERERSQSGVSPKGEERRPAGTPGSEKEGESMERPPAPMDPPPLIGVDLSAMSEEHPGVAEGADPGGEGSGSVLSYWHVDQGDASLEGVVHLELVEPGKETPPLVRRIPKTEQKNGVSVAGAVWREHAMSNAFDLTKERSFTLEFWFASHPIQGNDYKFVAGTRSTNAEDSRGWHLDFRPDPRRSIHFKFDPGRGKVYEAGFPGGEFLDGKPHHLALVWDHDGGGEGKGRIRLYLDGKAMAGLDIPHRAVPSSPTRKRFCIGDRPGYGSASSRFPGAMDEIRFSIMALPPAEFLNATPEGETVPPDDRLALGSAKDEDASVEPGGG